MSADQKFRIRYPPERIATELERGEVWLAIEREVIVGTLTLLQFDQLWNDLPAPARYLHRFAVRRAHRGLGTRMIDQACAHLAQSGIRSMRLDRERTNARLRSYYETLRFEHRGDTLLQMSPVITYDASRYERPISFLDGDRDPPASP